MKLACAPLVLVLVLVLALRASVASAFIIEPDLADAAKRADLVAVATPVKLVPLPVSYSIAYELATFEVTRVLASSAPYVASLGGNARPRICVFRLAKSDEIHFEPQALTVGAAYILVLQRLVPDGAYSALSSYYPILPATEENLRGMRKGIYGMEEERFAADDLALDAAEALALRAMAQIATAAAQLATDDRRFAAVHQADDAEKRTSPDDPF